MRLKLSILMLMLTTYCRVAFASPDHGMLEVDGNPVLCSNGAARLLISGSGATGESAHYSWSVAPIENVCLTSNQREAVFSATRPGDYEILVHAEHELGQTTPLTLQLSVVHCADQEFEPVCPGVAVAQLALQGETVGQCDCSGTGHAPPYLLRPRSLLVTRSFTAKPEPSSACPPTDDGAWEGTLSKFVECNDPSSCSIVQADCAYGYVGAATPDYTALGTLPLHPSSVGQDVLMIDQPVLGVMAAASDRSLPSDVWKPLQARYRKKLRFVDPQSVLGTATDLTRVAVIDSAALAYDVLNDADNFGHGRAVGRVIADLSCQAGDSDADLRYCGQFIRNYLALDQVGPNADKDRQNGGFFGDLATLELAINRAIVDWLHDGTQRSPTPLVINLSLGWDERHEYRARSDLERNLGAAGPARRTSLSPSRPISALASRIKLSLERASCLGAITIAAAGNADLPGDAGPTYPAAWAREPAPSDEWCQARGFIGPTGWPWGAASKTDVAKRAPDACRALLYAASGVGDQIETGEHADVLLASTRARGTSHLAAQALAAVTSEPRNGHRSAVEHTSVLSGSSMAAAAMSGSLALAWSMTPDLDGHRVMERVRANSEDRARGFDNFDAVEDFRVCGPNAPGVWVLTQCAAASQNGVAGCPSKEYLSSSLPALNDAQPSIESVADFNEEQVTSANGLPIFGAGYVPWGTGGGTGPVGPQPPSRTCPTCFVDTQFRSETWFRGSFVQLTNAAARLVQITDALLVVPGASSSVARLFGGSKPPVPGPNVQFGVRLSGITLSAGQAITMVTMLNDGTANLANTEPVLVR